MDNGHTTCTQERSGRHSQTVSMNIYSLKRGALCGYRVRFLFYVMHWDSDSYASTRTHLSVPFSDMPATWAKQFKYLATRSLLLALTAARPVRDGTQQRSHQTRLDSRAEQRLEAFTLQSTRPTTTNTSKALLATFVKGPKQTPA